MIPEIVIYYIREADGDRRPEEKIAKAAFVNVSDALTFWEALQDRRKDYLVMETLDGEPVTDIAHCGYNDASWGGYYGHGYYGHAYALTAKDPLPPRSGRDREDAARYGWEFSPIT